MHYLQPFAPKSRAGAKTLIGGEGVVYLYNYSVYARLISFEINFITQETSRAEPEYMNIHPPPPISVLAPALPKSTIFDYSAQEFLEF